LLLLARIRNNVDLAMFIYATTCIRHFSGIARIQGIGGNMILGSLFKKVKSISPDEVRTIIKEKSADKYCLLDVRQPGEYEQGHIPGAILIPLAELQSSMNRLHPDRMTIVYCRSGNRSRSGVGILNGGGLDDVYNMEGGILAYNGLVAAGPPEAGVFCFSEHMTPEQLIAMAWYIEDGSQRYFESVKNISQDHEIESNFTRLIEHKIAHKKSLLQLFLKMSGQAVNEDFPASVLQRPPHAVMAGCVGVSEAVSWSNNKNIADILDFLMSLEANTFDLYLKLGRQVASDRARKVFMELSEEEARHLERLSSIFEKTL
jgi:rhodanese-related sulfurtransferase/rubrerythrin